MFGDGRAIRRASDSPCLRHKLQRYAPTTFCFAAGDSVSESTASGGFMVPVPALPLSSTPTMSGSRMCDARPGCHAFGLQTAHANRDRLPARKTTLAYCESVPISTSSKPPPPSFTPARPGSFVIEDLI